MRKKILVCGATGFIGRNMVEAFAANENYEVYATCHQRPPFHDPRVKFLKVNLTNAEEVSSVVKGKDIIIQAAATTSGAKDIVSKPYIHVTDNAVMNSLIFRSAHDQGVGQVIFFSCTILYQSCDSAIKESDLDLNIELNRNYFGGGWTKIYLEKMCEFYSRLGSTRYSVIRHSNIYGPWDKFDLEKSHVFGATMTKVLTNTTGKITVWGDGSERRDLLYISDLVDYVKLAIEKQAVPLQLHNVGLGESISVSALVKKMIQLSGMKLQMEYDTTKPSLKTQITLDITQAREFGWRPQVSLDQGILSTIAWYRSQHLNTERKLTLEGNHVQPQL